MARTVRGYKLFRERADGTLGPLFINARQRIEEGVWLPAETTHRRKGFKYRPGWHAVASPQAPHLSERGRTWRRVELRGVEIFDRGPHHGGPWYLAREMRVLPGPVST